jgi:hypothetical protein
MKEITAAIFVLSISMGCNSVSGIWTGELTQVPAHGAAKSVMAGFVIDGGTKLPSRYEHGVKSGSPALLVTRELRAIDWDHVRHLGPTIKVTGRMTFANVRSSDGFGWVCGPPPRGIWDSYHTCWVVQADSIDPIHRQTTSSPK